MKKKKDGSKWNRNKLTRRRGSERRGKKIKKRGRRRKTLKKDRMSESGREGKEGVN